MKSLDKETFIRDLYTQKRTLTDDRFGEITLWSKKEGKHLIIMKSDSFDSIKDCEQAMTHVKERMKMNYDYLMKMVDYSVDVRAKNSFDVSAYYEAPLQDLASEIKLRTQQNR